jgi:hypothetical protein
MQSSEVLIVSSVVVLLSILYFCIRRRLNGNPERLGPGKHVNSGEERSTLAAHLLTCGSLTQGTHGRQRRNDIPRRSTLSTSNTSACIEVIEHTSNSSGVCLDPQAAVISAILEINQVMSVDLPVVRVSGAQVPGVHSP